MTRSLVRFCTLLTLLGALVASSTSAQVRDPRSQRGRLPTLAADRTQYAPGTLAVLSGAGFQPNESVTLDVTYADGTALGDGHRPWAVLVDGAGRFTTAWQVCEDECVGSLLMVTANGASSGTLAGTSFLNTHDCGTGVVASVTPVGGSCSAFTPAVGNGPDNYEVAEGGTYVMTLTGVTECMGDTITVFVQGGSTGNFCFNAVGGSGTYVGTFVMPDPACHTYPVSYKCGADAACTHPGSFGAQGPTSGCGGVHLRASTFDGSCTLTGSDDDCEPPPATGACCLVDGSCVEVTEADCLALGGTYSGDSTLCMDVVCEPAVGACCLPDGTCVQVSAQDCAAAGGLYHGDYSLCMDVFCQQPTGACCLVDDTCVEVTEEDCSALGGEFHGDGSMCADVVCESGGIVCYCLDFETDDEGNGMAHGARVDAEFDCNGTDFPVAITGSVDFSGSNTAAILNSNTGPAAQDPDLLVTKGNLLILQTDANLNECPANSGVYCSHNDDEHGGTLSFAFCAPVIPSSIVLVDIDGTDTASSVVLTDVNGKTRTYTVPGNWTGDRVTNFPELGWKVLNLTTLANQPGFASTATAGEQAGFDPMAVVQLDVHLGGSGAVDDLCWCQ